MYATSAVMRGRAAAERLMIDTCDILRRTGETTDPDTGDVVPVYAQVYTGKCRVQQADVLGQTDDLGEDAIVRVRHTLQLPMSVVGVEIDDEAQITASPLDPDLLGRTWLVRGLAHKTHATARRIHIEERQ